MWRRRAWTRVAAHLAESLPGVDVVAVDDGGDPFSRGGSLNQAFATTTADVVVACDADLLVPADQLLDAVELAESEPGMVVPFDTLVYTRQRVSLDIIERRTPLDAAEGDHWAASPTIPCLGGCNVLSRDTWERAGGWLPAFRGWGCEDIAMAAQCATLVAPLRRIPGPAVHLWHPKTGGYVDPQRIEANGALMARVLETEGDPAAMRQVVEELRDAS